MDGRNEANAFNDGLADLLSLLPPPQFVVPGFTLFDQNAHASWIGLLCSGIVKLSVLDSRGIEHNLGLRGRGYWINAEEALISCIFAAMMGLLYGSRVWAGQRLWLATAGVGVLCGSAALTQPGLMLLPAVILLAEFLLTRRISPALLRTTVATAAMVCTILPWTVRNYVDYGRLIPISSNGGSVFYRANNSHANAAYSGEGEVVLPKDTIAADREGYAMAKDWIMHHPLAFTTLAIRKQVVFWGDDGDGIYEGLKRNQSPNILLYSGLKLVTSVYWWALWIALLCCWRPLTHALDWPAWFGVSFLPLAYQWVIDSVYESGSRHHLAHTSCVAVLIACAFAAVERQRSLAAAKRARMQLLDDSQALKQ